MPEQTAMNSSSVTGIGWIKWEDSYQILQMVLRDISCCVANNFDTEVVTD